MNKKRSTAQKKNAKRNPWIAHVLSVWTDDGRPVGEYMEYVKSEQVREEYYEIKDGHSTDYMRTYYWLWSPYMADSCLV